MWIYPLDKGCYSEINKTKEADILVYIYVKNQKNIYRDRYLYLLLAPMIIWVILFKYKPLYGLQIAFKDYSLFKGIADSPWVGLEHFKTFFTGPYF